MPVRQHLSPHGLVRNVVLHRCLQVDLAIRRRVVERDLDDLLAFVRAVRDRLPG